MMEIWKHRGWHVGELHNDFCSECLVWLKLLLSIVKMTDPSAPNLLRKFLIQRRGNIVTDREFSCHIVNQILEDTHKNFHLLSIQQFFVLYKNFRIWPIEVCG